MWSGHSCPLAFDFAFELDREGHGFNPRRVTPQSTWKNAASAPRQGIENRAGLSPRDRGIAGR